MAESSSTSDLLECAVAAARRAGTHALENRARRKEVVKRFTHDVKLQLDLECQKIAEDVVTSTFPSHSFLGEEKADTNIDSNTGYQWIVDPIDGTVNFSHGLPFWCCSVAVRKDEETLAGAVYAPMLNEIYTAAIDGPAQLNGENITTSDTCTLHDSIIHTGTDKSFEGNPSPLRIFRAIALACQRARVTGFAAYDLCQVAAGRADGYFEGEIYIWDVAAGGLIIERAGGRIERILEPDQSWKLSFMASNGKIHEEFKSVIAEA